MVSQHAMHLPRTTERRQRTDDLMRVMRQLQGLPLDCGWRVQAEQTKSERSIQQNRYLFGVAYPLLIEATGYESEDVHDYLLRAHFGTKLKRVPKSKLNPEGLREVPVRTTTSDENGRRSVLGKIAFAEYVAFVQRFAAEKVGIVIPDPDPELAEAA